MMGFSKSKSGQVSITWEAGDGGRGTPDFK